MTMISRKLLRRDPAGFEVWKEISRPEFESFVMDDAGDPEGAQAIADDIEDASGRLVTLEVCYAPNGGYIGMLDVAEFLCREKGIAPETIENNTVCSIGFCEREQKWYGWSHRAIYGFGVGDIAKEGDCCTTSGWTDEYLEDHPDDKPVPIGFEAKTLDDAKRMAIAFASSVS